MQHPTMTTARNKEIPNGIGQSMPRRCKRSRNTKTTFPRRRNGTHLSSIPYCLFLLSCLLLRHHSDFYESPSILAAHAFVTDTTSRSTTNNNNRLGRNQQEPHYQQCSSITTTTSTSTTALHFFFNNPQETNRDLPLARYVDVSANYTLAHTPEDYIDLRENQRLVCVGDVHGDLAALQVFLETAGVYHRATDSWCGGNTILVQCGDVLDRGLEELACYRLLAKLSQQALLQQGKVILLVGNHEALNAMGLFQYAFTDHEHEQTIGKQVDAILGVENQWRKQYANNQPARWASYEPGGLLAHSLLKNMKVAVRVGKTLCVHAGLLPHHLTDHGGISKMNAAFSDWISLGDDLALEDPYKQEASSSSEQPYYKQPLRNNPVVYNHNGNYATPRQPWIDAEQRQQYYINTIPQFLQSKPGDPGPIWMRDYSTPHDAPPNPTEALQLEKDLDTTLTLVDADRMVMGHTIQQRINGIFGGKAWRLDVGASKGCLHGTPEVLEVVCQRHGESSNALGEKVFVLVPSQGSSQQPQQQQPVVGCRIPANERLVDAYTQAAVEML